MVSTHADETETAVEDLVVEVDETWRTEAWSDAVRLARAATHLGNEIELPVVTSSLVKIGR